MKGKPRGDGTLRAASTRARARRPRLTEKETRFLKARAHGRGRVQAVREAGYNMAASKDCSSRGLKIEAKIRDTGILAEALDLAGVNQEAVAEAIARAIHLKDPKHIGVRLRAAEVACKLLGYDRPQQAPPELPDLPFDDIATMSVAIVRELKRRGQDVEAAGGIVAAEPEAGFATPAT